MKSVGLPNTSTLELQGEICRTGTKNKVFKGRIQSDMGHSDTGLILDIEISVLKKKNNKKKSLRLFNLR